MDGPSHFDDYARALNDEYKNRQFERSGLPILRISADNDYVKNNEKVILDQIGKLLKSKLNHDLGKTNFVNYQYLDENRQADNVVRVKQLSNQMLFDQLFELY